MNSLEKKNSGDLVQDLKLSKKRIGRLYPVLEDFYGNLIDGQHRLEADREWPRLRLNQVKSEKERIIAKLISNACRRSVPRHEKAEMIGKLGELLLREHVKPGELSKKIAEDLGMSYTWVMKYLPEQYKDHNQSINAKFATRHVAKPHYSSGVIASLCSSGSVHKLIERIPPNQKFLEPKYSSTDYAIYAVNRVLDGKIAQTAKRMRTTPAILVQKVIEIALKEIDKLEIDAIKPNIVEPI